MSVEESRARIRARVQAAVTGSNIAFSSSQRGQLDELIDSITDNVLLEFDSLLDAQARAAAPAAAAAPRSPIAAAQLAAAEPAAPVEEQVLWEGRPFLSIGERYIITNERVRIVTGVVGRENEDIELIRVQDVDHKQGMSERMFNIGDIFLRTADRSQGDIVLRNVPEPEKVHEILRRAVLNARRKYPFVFEQEMEYLLAAPAFGGRSQQAYLSPSGQLRCPDGLFFCETYALLTQG